MTSIHGFSGRRARRRAMLLAAAAGLLAAGCREGADRVRAAEAGIVDATAAVEGAARRIVTIDGFDSPESVRYDPELDVFYVSSMRLFGSLKDDNGYISRIEAGDLRAETVLVRGGEDGVTLHAPKGMALHGDTLWVADIDVLRGFHRVSGAPLATIDFAPYRPTLLNDVAVGADGTIRVTDTGIVMSPRGTIYDTTGSRIFEVGAGRAIGVIPAAEPWPNPNGITWDAGGDRWLVVTFGHFRSALYSMGAADTVRTTLAEGNGRWDGVEALADGRIVLSSWSDSSLHVVDSTARRTRIVRGVPEPADIGIDTRRGRIAIPLPMSNRVEIWTIPARR